MTEFTSDAERLVAIADQMCSQFKWYDNLLHDSGYADSKDPGKIPLITEATLQDHYYDYDHPQLKNSYTYNTSGTTTGFRRRILYSAKDRMEFMGQRRELFSQFIPTGCKVACYDLGSTGLTSESAELILPELGLITHKIDYRLPIEVHIELLNRYKPDVLFTMPMILENLVNAGNIDFHPKKIIVVGDIASASWKNHVLDFFDLSHGDLMDIYGCHEIGAIAYQCWLCGTYHFHDHIIPETIQYKDLCGESESSSDAEILVVTSSSRSYFPAVRYITYDIVAGLDRRKCGDQSCLSFERILGRCGYDITYGERLNLYVISEAINRYIPGARFDVVKGLNHFTINIASSRLNDENADNIKREILAEHPSIEQMIVSALLRDFVIQRVDAGSLPRQFKRVINYADHVDCSKE